MQLKKIVGLSLSVLTFTSGVLGYSNLGKDNSKKAKANISQNVNKIKSTKKSENKNQDKNKSVDSSSKKSDKETKKETKEEILSKNIEANSSPNEQVTSNSPTNDNQQSNQTNIYQPVTPSQPRVQTEWEKLGISEYDYYHTPAPNEGEIAKDVVDCGREAGRINTTYDFVTHYGDVYSYSENYIGCWITIHFNDGSWMFYNSFRDKEKRGEFN